MQNNLVNYHSHCDFCDGRAPMEAFVEAAVACGMKAYGVSSHTESPEPGRTLHRDTYAAYFAEIARLREKYRHQIELYAALEIDYIDEARNAASPMYRRMPLDYTIGSVHFVPAPDGGWMSVDGAYEGFRERLAARFGNDVRAVVELFYEQSRKMVAAGGFTICGHADKIALNASYFHPGITQEAWYEELASQYIHSLAGKDFLVEVNTKAWEQHHRLFPSVEWFPLMRRLGLKLVVNSDCHYPERVNSGRLQAMQLLRQAGIREVWELHSGRWAAVPICV